MIQRYELKNVNYRPLRECDDYQLVPVSAYKNQRPDEAGEWCSAEDVAALEARIAELEAENEKLRAQVAEHADAAAERRFYD